MFKSLILAGGCSLAFFFTHVILFFARRIANRFKTMNVIAGFFLLSYACLFALLPAESYWCSKILGGAVISVPRPYAILSFGLGGFIYVMLYMGYLEFYFTADRSMTIRILREIELRGPRGMSADDVSKVYDIHAYYRRRFEEMTESGYLRLEGPKYFVTQKGARTARLYTFVIRTLHLEGG